MVLSRRTLNSSNLLLLYLPGDSDSSEVTETLLSEAQEQALKNSVPEGEEEDEAEGGGEDIICFTKHFHCYFAVMCTQ
jgi:hypothetical protein